MLFRMERRCCNCGEVLQTRCYASGLHRM
jgi:hypothetical protein